MNMYRALGDRIGTLEARDLAQQLVEWHDTMVRHLRVTAQQPRRCADGCPHDEARALWLAASSVFGDGAAALAFLRQHGAAHSRGGGAGMVQANA
jgi:hypothetical protein